MGGLCGMIVKVNAKLEAAVEEYCDEGSDWMSDGCEKPIVE